MIVDTVEFIRTAVGGVAHVLADTLYLPHLDSHQHVTRCGRQARPGADDVVRRVDDVALCWDCWHATPAGDRLQLLLGRR